MSKIDGNGAHPPMGMRLSPSLRKLQILLFAFGVLALSYVALILAGTAFFQRRAVGELNKNVALGAPAVGAAQEAASPGKTPGRTLIQPVADGTPFAQLQIQRLKLDAVVIEGDNDKDLREGIGHIPSTALPGYPGNVGLAGHRDTFFRPLRNIRKGDLVTLTTLQGTHQYQVESTEIVLPKDSWVLAATPDPSLTLVTCFPFYYVGSAPKRFIVHAREIDPAAPLVSDQISR